MAATKSTEEYKKYSNPVLGVSLEFPSQWNFEESPSVGIVVFADAAALKSQNLGPLSPVVNMITQKIPGIDLSIFSEQQLVRMKEMTGGNITVEKNAKLGSIPAHKAVSSLPIPGGQSIKFFSLWAYADGVGYSFFFHCPSSEYGKYGSIISHMLKSFEKIRILPLSYPLETYSDNGIVLRYPAGWKATPKTDMTAKGPFVTLSHEETEKGETLTTTVKLSYQPKQGPLETHIELLKVQLEKMHVENVNIVSTKVGTKDARVMFYTSDAQEEGMRYMQLLSTESDSNDSPILTMLMTVGAKKNEYDQAEDIFRQLRSTLVFLSEGGAVKATSKYEGYYHLKFNFGFLFDPERYSHRAEGIPLTEASFIRKGDDPANPLVNFSVIVRELGAEEEPDLAAMGEDLQENLKGVCGNSLERVLSESVTMCGLPARLIIFHGSATSPVNPSDVEEMYFVYKYVINKATKTALLFAFASTPKFWQAEWKLVESYLDTLYWSA